MSCRCHGSTAPQFIHVYFRVSGFAIASILYVTVNGIPSVLWKTKAEPANVSEPVLIGVLDIDLIIFLDFFMDRGKVIILY